MKNDFDLENPEVSYAEEAQIVRVSGNGNVVGERGGSEATTDSGGSSGGVEEAEVPPGFDSGADQGTGDFGRIKISAGDDFKGEEEFRVAGVSGRVEAVFIDLNHGVGTEESVHDFNDPNSGASGGDNGFEGSFTMATKDAADEETYDCKGSGADDGYRMQKRAVTEYHPLTSNASSDAGVTTRAGSLNVGFGFQMGDMVWGKVKSHPWWPGHIFNQAFVSSHVRRTRRHGHALVAFFGDSSYGWFETAELIPYDPNYAEKSRQTNSKNFMKAVEESEDEASRRAALGLSCRCRNPYNFRPTNVQGYFIVDVVDYEPGGVYSVGQIKRARDGFQPHTMLSFVKQLALAPTDVEMKNIDFIKSKSMSLAYRRAIFEEFDETYAQAFGQQPVPPTRLSSRVIDQSAKDITRGLLSGRQVFAETLGGRKSSAKALKTKEHAKKDRYLFKRRDEPKDSRTHQIDQGNMSSSLSPAYEDEPSVSAAGDYVLQRREQAVSASEEQISTPRRNEVAASSIIVGGSDSGAGPARIGCPDMSGKELSTDLPRQYGSSVSSGGQELDALLGGSDSGKIIKCAKRPVEEFSFEKPDLGQRKKRKKAEAELRSAAPHKQPLASSGMEAGNSMQIDTALTEDSKLGHLRKDVKTTSSPSVPGGQMPLSGVGESEVELPELLGDLQALALNPLHGAQRSRPATVTQVFLRFRSLVFRKSLAAQPPVSELHETRAVRPPPVSGPPADAAATTIGGPEDIRSVPPSKPSKPLSRLDDPTRAGKKRIPSEQPEETTAKRSKKVGDAKPFGAEKRAIQKTSEMQHADGRGKDMAAAPPPQRTAKAESLRRTEPPRKVEEPTYLIIKFPPGSSLPTFMELKARFARFGSMDPEGNRVFYKTTTCRVLFLYKEDAERAQQYADSVFPNAKLLLKPLSGRGEDEPTPAQPQAPAAGPPKSILKKPTGDEAGPGVRGTRVRFNVGEEDTSAREVQTMDYRNNNSSFQEATGPSSVAMDFTSNQKVISASNPLPPLLPLPAFPPRPYSRAIQYQQHAEAGPRVDNNYNPIIGLPAQAPTVDVAQQMLMLLLECKDIVANVTSKLGYVPYHPL
ncbi:hypothetical protein Dimus_012180 [Dionaea muscipula]